MLMQCQPLDLSMKRPKLEPQCSPPISDLESIMDLSCNRRMMETESEEALNLTLPKKNSQVKDEILSPSTLSSEDSICVKSEACYSLSEHEETCEEESSIDCDHLDAKNTEAQEERIITAIDNGNHKETMDSLTDISLDQKEVHCKYCGMPFTSLKLYYEHILNHAKQYKCHICNKGYKQVRAYRAHLVTHKNNDRFTCDICGKVLSTSTEYLDHLKIHGRKDLHVCDYCGKYFRDSCTLQTHKWIHTGEKPFKCKVCNKAFRQSGTLSRHMKVHLA